LAPQPMALASAVGSTMPARRSPIRLRKAMASPFFDSVSGGGPPVSWNPRFHDSWQNGRRRGLTLIAAVVDFCPRSDSPGKADTPCALGGRGDGASPRAP